MEERKGLIQWIRRNMKALIAAGIGVGALILIVLGIKNREEICKVWASLVEIVKHPTAKDTAVHAEISAEALSTAIPVAVPPVVTEQKLPPFDVTAHIRNLPDGWHRSAEKTAEIILMNIDLKDNQTWVDTYTKRRDAA